MATRGSRKKKASKKEMTLNEFKAWLAGVEELQPDDWYPNLDQWITIREKIDAIVEPEEKIQYVPQPVQQPVFQSPPQMIPQPVPMESQFPNETQDVLQSTLSGTPPTQMSNGTTTGTSLKMEGGKIKTPNIDTTDGQYNSLFS